ncbi:hypothetical protein [Janthinobacterium aquaticum]|nr:hypothetical protein [Janthinobacterium sp. FT58W]
MEELNNNDIVEISGGILFLPGLAVTVVFSFGAGYLTGKIIKMLR